MTNENIEIVNEEEVKGNRFTKHLKKHKYVYMAVAGAGLTVLGMKVNMNSKLKEVAYKGYQMGCEDMNALTWGVLAKNVKEGIIQLDLIGETNDAGLKHNIEAIKKFVESGEE